ncbi:AmmeMemoRadiSam system protein B [bacterium]|nr:AmmeMemoRadiSam system protein B [bacterium]
MSTYIRYPNYGGRFGFYPDNPSMLKNFIKSVTDLPNKQIEGKGVIVPHAGYPYSGKTLYKTLKALKTFPETIIIIGPNHSGLGQDVAMISEGSWQIMGKSIQINSGLAKSIQQVSRIVQNDYTSHQKEHSIEVILPLLLSIQPEFRLVPIIMRNYHPSVVEDISQAIIFSFQTQSSTPLVIASSDMSHYVSQIEAKRKDEIAFQAIRHLDGKQLLSSVQQEHISMCGSGPVAVAMNIAKSQGATQATLIDYTDSSEETKDTSEVVSYAGFIFH